MIIYFLSFYSTTFNMVFYIVVLVLIALFLIFNICMLWDQYTTIINSSTGRFIILIKKF